MLSKLCGDRFVFCFVFGLPGWDLVFLAVLSDTSSGRITRVVLFMLEKQEPGVGRVAQR